MSRPYAPAPWLTNPHLQTLWSRLFRTVPTLPFTGMRLDTPDDDFVEVLRVPARSETAPTVLLLHGLEGTSRSHYVTGTLQHAVARGWDANLLLFRTCGGEMNRQPRSYHSGETSDLDLVVQHLWTERPRSPLVLVGVSLGGNVLLKWLGERGPQLTGRVTAATAISVPFDLAASSRHIDASAGGLYRRRFLRSLRHKALQKLERFPNLADIEAVRRADSLWAFDDAYTSVVHGFRDAADYYKQSSSIHFLPAIRVPTLLLNAIDDPFHPPEVLDRVRAIAASTPPLIPEFVPVGGHVGFVEGRVPWRVGSYCERRSIEFAEALLPSSSVMP